MSKTMENKIVKVYVLKGLNGTSLVIENYRVSDEKIYGMLTPIYTFEVATDDILQAIGQDETSTTLVTMADKLDQIKQIVNEWNNDASHSFEDMCKINGILKE